MDTNKIIDTIISNGSENMQREIPKVGQGGMESTGRALLNNPNVANEFLSSLVNKVALTTVISKMFTNKLAFFKGEKITMGSYIENIGVNPIKGENFKEMTGSLFTDNLPDEKVEYHQINREKQYTVTITRVMLKRAFTSSMAFGNLVETIIQQLYNGATLEEYRSCRDMLGEAISTGNVLKVEVKKGDTKDLLANIIDYTSLFPYPSDKYNAWKVKKPGDSFETWCETNDQVLLLTERAKNRINLDELASAYNLSKVELLSKIISVDNFGTGAENVQGLLCDKSFVKMHDDEYIMSEFHNTKFHKHNFYLTIFQIMSYSFLANAVAFVEPTTM